MPGGYLLLAFQAEDEPIHRTNAHGTQLPLTSYRHSVQDVADRLKDRGFNIYTTVVRAPDLENETAFQGFVIASARPHSRRIMPHRTGVWEQAVNVVDRCGP